MPIEKLQPSLLSGVESLVADLIASGTPDVYDAVRRAVDRAVFAAADAAAGGSQIKAARLLGISRTTLRQRAKAAGTAMRDGRRKDGAA